MAKSRKKKKSQGRNRKKGNRTADLLFSNDATNAAIYSPAPIGVNYFAVSPEESSTSAHDLNQRTFENIFQVSAVKRFDDLFSKSDDVPESREPPSHWAEQLMGEVRAANSEGLMNAAIQKALKQDVQDVVGLGIHSADADANATKAGLVKEEQLWNLMSIAYGERLPHQGHVNVLPISLESLPDFSIWSTSKTFLLTGEGKNQKKYDVLHCRRQAAAYMLAHLFSWIVVKKMAVEAVYGVAFCGPSARLDDGVECQVALLRLSLPSCVGGMLQLEEFTISENLDKDLNYLWKFADRVCRMDTSRAKKLRWEIGLRPPC